MKIQQLPCPATPTIAQPIPTLSSNSLRSLLIGSKEFLPWILAACQVVSWFGVKYLTSDRMQQQQLDDHVALGEMKAQIGKLEIAQSGLSSKLDLLISFNVNKR